VSREHYNHFLGALILQLSRRAFSRLGWWGMMKMGLSVDTFQQPLFKNEGLKVPGARNLIASLPSLTLITYIFQVRKSMIGCQSCHNQMSFFSTAVKVTQDFERL
jgi:hypothetical protein